MSPCEPPALSSSECAGPVLEDLGVEVDNKVWDVASTPSVERLIPSGSLGRGNPPSVLFSSLSMY